MIRGMREQPWDLGRKLRILRRAKLYVRQHEGALQQRLAHERTAKDVLARGQLLVAKVCRCSTRLYLYLDPLYGHIPTYICTRRVWSLKQSAKLKCLSAELGAFTSTT